VEVLGASGTSVDEAQPRAPTLALFRRHLADRVGNIARPDDGRWRQSHGHRPQRNSGRFFVVFHREGRGPRGSGKEIGILGYDPTRKVYTYENFSDDGDVGRATATISGDTWVVLAPATDNCQKVGDNFKERFTIKEVSPISYTFINEISVDGGPWTKIEQGKAAKK